MANFNTIWSVDLGKSSLKAVKLRRERNNIEILAIDKIDYPIGTNGVDAVQQAREALNAFKVRNSVREPVVVAHPGQGTFSRFIKVPAFEAKKLKEMVGYEASQQIPFPLDEVIWDYHLVNRDYLNGEEREVGIFAVRKEAIDDYLLDFTNEGLSVEMLSIGYLGLLNYIFFDLAPPEPSIVVDIGATHTDLILVDGKKFWIRALPHSGNDINKAIMERFKVSFQEAEKLKIDSAKVPQQAVKIFSSVIQPKLKDLVGEIHRSVGYYRSQAGEVKFQNLFLLGNGSRIVGIKKYLAEQLGVQVHRMQTLRHFRVNREVDLKLLQNELPAFATAFGCALQGVGMGSCQVDLVPQEERVQKELKRSRWHAFYALGVVIACIVLAAFVVDSRLKEAAEVGAEHAGWIKSELRKYEQGESGDVKVLEWEARQIERIAELRGAVLTAMRTIGSVIPPDNVKVVVEKGPEKDKSQLEGAANEKLVELNKSKVWVPYLKVERIQWPEISAAEAKSEKKSAPTVPAYRITIYGTVIVQGGPDESLALLRKLLVDPLTSKLKATPELTVDPEVKVSQAYNNDLKRNIYHPSAVPGAGGGGGGAGSRGPAAREEDTPQEAGPFFGTEIAWTVRLREPKDDPKPQTAPPPSAKDDSPTGKPPRKPVKK